MENAKHHRMTFCTFFSVAILFAACSSGTSSQGEDGSNQDATQDTDSPPQAGPDCDPLQPSYCSLPWPSNLYLAADSARVTGYTLTFGATSLPANLQDDHVNPEAYRQLDGYGAGSTIMVHFPGIDTSTLPGEDAIADSLAPGSPIVLLEVSAEGVRRVPHWAELDLTSPDPQRQVLYVRPAEILKEATRYIVAFRNLVGVDGQAIGSSDAFASLRDSTASPDPEIEKRREHFETIFAILSNDGVSREELTLAWDFVTASSEALHSKMLAIRDHAWALTETEGLELTVENIKEFTVEENEHIALEITGTYRVPHYMKEFPILGKTGWVFNLDETGQPQQSGWFDADFWIRIPHTALDGTPHCLVQYGHGLNGLGAQVRGSHNSKVAYDYHCIFFATNMLGMSEEDVDIIVKMLTDLSRFPVLADRVHQGMLNYLLLPRAIAKHLTTHPDVAQYGLQLKTDESYYSGISQGGIYGGVYMALAKDVRRGHLGVPGQNYSLLLHRSVDFKPFFDLLQVIYPDKIEQSILLMAIQLLWDRVDSVSYYRHIKAEPFPGTEPHDVLLASATGDHQVALVTNEITARSNVGIALMPDYGKPVELVTETPYPHVGSGIVNYSFGNPWPAIGNLPPTEEVEDPHGKPRHLEHHQKQMMHFFKTGEIIDVCGGDGCTPD